MFYKNILNKLKRTKNQKIKNTPLLKTSVELLDVFSNISPIINVYHEFQNDVDYNNNILKIESYSNAIINLLQSVSKYSNPAIPLNIIFEDQLTKNNPSNSYEKPRGYLDIQSLTRNNSRNGIDLLININHIDVLTHEIAHYLDISHANLPPYQQYGFDDLIPVHSKSDAEFIKLKNKSQNVLDQINTVYPLSRLESHDKRNEEIFARMFDLWYTSMQKSHNPFVTNHKMHVIDYSLLPQYKDIDKYMSQTFPLVEPSIDENLLHQQKQYNLDIFRTQYQTQFFEYHKLSNNDLETLPLEFQSEQYQEYFWNSMYNDIENILSTNFNINASVENKSQQSELSIEPNI